MEHERRHSTLPLWPLPLLCAALPFFATWIAFALSAQAGYIDACNPFWDGCTSISRAARHGLGNHVFRAAMMPAATLQILMWLLTAAWLHRQRRMSGLAVALAVAFGLLAGLAMILYATFLGTDGGVYRLLRSYGVKLYFAFTYLALLLVLRCLRGPPVDPLYRPLLAIAVAMLALGLGSTAVSALVADDAFKDRLENALEWQLGVWLCAMFAAFAWRWRCLRLSITGESGRD